MKPENKVKENIRDLVKTLTPYHLTVTTGGMGESGHPDRLCCVLGHFVGIEAKATAKQQPSKLQKKRLRDLRTAGGFCFVVDADNFPKFRVLITTLFEPGHGAAHRIEAYEALLRRQPEDQPYWR